MKIFEQLNPEKSLKILNFPWKSFEFSQKGKIHFHTRFWLTFPTKFLRFLQKLFSILKVFFFPGFLVYWNLPTSFLSLSTSYHHHRILCDLILYCDYPLGSRFLTFGGLLPLMSLLCPFPWNFCFPWEKCALLKEHPAHREREVNPFSVSEYRDKDEV